MRDYLLSGEWVRFAFVLGIAVSMVLYEKRHLTTGSIVVPGYIAVFMIHPLVIVATFINALLTYAVVNKFLTRHFLLYGRTKFTVLAVTSTAIQTVMLRLSPSGTWLWEMDIPMFIGVGYIVPALIAHDMGRQGIKKTSLVVMLSGLIVLIPIAAALVLDLPGVNDLSPVSGFGNTAINLDWIPFAIVLSVLASWAVAHNYGMRSGGFVGAAFVGMFMADPLQVVVAAAIAGVTYLIVAKFLMKHMILFGRRKFSAMLLVSSSIAWSGLWVGDRFLSVEWEQRLGVGSLALTPLMLPGLLANDAQRTSPGRVVQGVSIAGTFAVTTTWWVESIVEGVELHPVWKVISATATLILYRKQLVTLVQNRRAKPVEDEHTLELVADPDITDATSTVDVHQRPDTRSADVKLMLVPDVPDAEDSTAIDREWEEWVSTNPVAANDAEQWLEQQLAELDAARWLEEQLAGGAGSSAGSDPATQGTADASDAFDFDTSLVLEVALMADRGMHPVPRRPRVDTGAEAAPSKISETSDAAREAQLVASDVSDEPDRRDRDDPRREERKRTALHIVD